MTGHRSAFLGFECVIVALRRPLLVFSTLDEIESAAAVEVSGPVMLVVEG